MALLLTTAILAGCTKKKSAAYLAKRIPKEDKRYPSFLYVLDLMTERQAKVIVETGTARNGQDNCLGDGCSTIILGEWAKDHDAVLYSVDIDPQAIANARQAVAVFNDKVNFIVSDSVALLKNFRQYNQQIDFLYLDSFDVDRNNPDPSQQHHLKEIKAAYPFLGKNSIIMIDDCFEPEQGCKTGKGKLVIEFLLSEGWKKSMNGYQTILVK